MGLGSGRSLCRGEGVSGAPAAVGGRGLHPDSSLSPTLISDSTCGGELTGSPIHHNDNSFLWYRIVVIMCCMIAGQRPASAASSGAAATTRRARKRAPLGTTTTSTEIQNRGVVYLWFCVLD